MTGLYLKFTDETGFEQRILVERSPFIVGRHSGCDLCVPNNKLSREHLKIEAFGNVYVAVDSGSSNGTTLNGARLNEPVALKNGDVLNLGGGIEIVAEIIAAEPKERKTTNYSAAASGAQASDGSSIPTVVFIAAPILAVVLLVCGGGALYFFGGDGGNRNKEITNYYPTPDETPDEMPEKTPTVKPSSTTGGNSTPTIETSPETIETPVVSDEKKKIEANSAAFLQRIALNDPTAFLKGTEIDLVSTKLASFKGSDALADNLKAVKNNASQFQTLAQSRGLKPQFLAAAALTELGNSRGNPLETAQRMLPIFGELRVTLANNLADDNLMMVAAYNQGKAGKFKDLRNVLEALAKKNPGTSPREIRTVWFLKKQGKLTDAEFDFALKFLAIGTITQNPKDFGVNAEAVIFN